ncbi:MAG: methyltransferase [Candidatus Ozemobacter sibiricus]|jgi:SAM-dependent methyltransferase|uniref:Methyltransferase n=1 Tax=Candidatus Ozemobacter sibiricus TaxID=2268124 RepID=A0A367ZQ84_9BACT|nr:MAG: methyltransferase [Candidatus Ozemobacter sibiricus]
MHRPGVAGGAPAAAAATGVGPTPAAVEFDFDAVFAPDDYLYFYETTLPQERSRREADFIEQALDLQPAHRILDVACGHGRLTNLLARRGYRLTGVDRSAGFLEIARREAQAQGLAVDYRQGDMRDLSFDEPFDRALLTFTAFGYFSDDDNLLVLRRIRRVLAPGGRFLFDVLNRDTFLKRFVPSLVTERGDDLMIDRTSFDQRRGRVTTHRTIIRDGQRRDMRFSMRLYNLTELEFWLREAGLTLERVCGGYSGGPVDHEAHRLVLIARRPD